MAPLLTREPFADSAPGAIVCHRTDNVTTKSVCAAPKGAVKLADALDAGLLPALLALVEPDVRGDPMWPLRWTTKSTRKLAGDLTRLEQNRAPAL